MYSLHPLRITQTYQYEIYLKVLQELLMFCSLLDGFVLQCSELNQWEPRLTSFRRRWWLCPPFTGRSADSSGRFCDRRWHSGAKISAKYRLVFSSSTWCRPKHQHRTRHNPRIKTARLKTVDLNLYKCNKWTSICQIMYMYLKTINSLTGVPCLFIKKWNSHLTEDKKSFLSMCTSYNRKIIKSWRKFINEYVGWEAEEPEHGLQ